MTNEELQLKDSDIVSLIETYLKNNENLRDIENDHYNVVDGLLVHWNFTNIPKPTNSELLALKSQTMSFIAQKQINEEAEKFLKESDWMVLRHIRQVALNESLSLTQQQYLDLEQERSTKANLIIR